MQQQSAAPLVEGLHPRGPLEKAFALEGLNGKAPQTELSQQMVCSYLTGLPWSEGPGLSSQSS